MTTSPDARAGVRDDALPVYRLALEEARTAFADLMAQPDKIRRNVGALLGFAGIAVTVFGFSASRPASKWEWIVQIVAIASIVGLAACTAYVTTPHKLNPSMHSDDIVGWGDEGDGEAASVRNLALAYESAIVRNQNGIRRIFRAQIVAAILFGVTVIALALRALGA